MLTVLGFLAALGPLVIFHEFGHYLFARIFGVKPEVFSVGFGPRIFSKKIGETEWCVSVIPLGGYVKLLGDEGDREIAPEDQNRTLQSKAPWKRFFIFFGGPLFNFVLAFLIFLALFIRGDQQPASILGRVVKGSAAALAGFRSGDQILSTDGTPVSRFLDLEKYVSARPNQEIIFEVKDRLGSPSAPARIVRAAPTREEGFSPYGEVLQVGTIDGWVIWPRTTRVGVSDPLSLAGRAGIKTGDLLTELNGQKVEHWEQVERIFEGLPLKGTVQLKVNQQALSFVKSSQDLAELTGLRSSEMFIDSVVPGSPAERAGLKSGDRLVGVGDSAVSSFMSLKDSIQKSGETTGKIPLRLERAGKLVEFVIVPTATEMTDPILRKSIQFTVGVIPKMELGEPEMIVEKIRNPFLLVAKAFGRMVELSKMNLVSISKMIRGEVSPAVMGGPISIGKIAGDSLSRGLVAFLTTMAMLSVGLGVINLLPIPVLDGGHLMLLTLEIIRGKPLSLRQMEVIQQVGLSLILLLMVFVIRNDIARMSFFK